MKSLSLVKLIIFVLLVFVTIVLTWTVVIDIDKRARENLLVQARFIAHSINLKDLIKLSGKKTDTNLPNYLEIKEQLKKIRLSNKKCRFLYLLGQRTNGQIFFFVDSQIKNSTDYAEPGLLYNEVSDAYLQVFQLETEAVAGPITDRWGTLITALVPVKDSKGKLIAMLGMDIEVEHWYKKIVGLSLLPVSLLLFITILILLLFNLRQKTKQLNAARKKAQLLSMHDPLTNLPNRRYFREYIESKITQAKRYNEKIAFLYIDLDGFKAINDEISHQAGDEVLTTLGKRFNQFLRKNEFIARLGGDEFCMIVYNNKDKEELKNTAKRLIKKTTQPMSIVGMEVNIGMSIGISLYPEDGSSFDELLSSADIAMYEAKDKERGAYIFAT